MRNYIDLALRTKSQEFNKDAGLEFAVDKTVSSVKDLFETFADAGNLADGLKKALFYGRVIDEVPETKINIDLDTVNPDQLHGVLGIISEIGELLEALESGDEVNISEECGGICWYLALILKTINSDFETVMQKNIAQLEARYPGLVFSTTQAFNRNLDAERVALES